MQLVDEQIDVVAPPVSLIGKIFSIAGEGSVVVKLYSGLGIGVEVIVNVDAVHVVARHDVRHHQADVLPALRQGGVEEELVAVGDEPFGVYIINMIGRQLVLGRVPHAVRVYPGVQLHAALVAFVYHELQGIPIRVGRLSLHPRQVAAPRLQARGVERIGLRAYLEEDGVDARLLQGVELVDQRLLHFLRRHTFELAVDGLYPGTAKFAFGMTAGSVGRLRPKSEGQERPQAEE